MTGIMRPLPRPTPSLQHQAVRQVQQLLRPTRPEPRLLIESLLTARQLQLAGRMSSAVPLLGAAASAMQRILESSEARAAFASAATGEAGLPAGLLESLTAGVPAGAAAAATGRLDGAAGAGGAGSARRPVGRGGRGRYVAGDSDADGDEDEGDDVGDDGDEPWPCCQTELGSPPPNGLTLEGLQAVIDLAGGAEVLDDRSTGWLKYSVVLPATAACKRAMTAWIAEHVSAEMVRPATVFVSHAYENGFAALVETLTAWEGQQRAQGRRGPFSYYIDLLSVPQHGMPTLPFTQLQREFGSSVRSIGRVLLVLDWPARQPLTRAWCVFEIFTAMAVRAHFRVTLPPSHEASLRQELVADPHAAFRRICAVNCATAEACEAEDLRNIRALIRTVKGGFGRVNDYVVAAMQGWLVETGIHTLLQQHTRGHFRFSKAVTAPAFAAFSDATLM